MPDNPNKPRMLEVSEQDLRKVLKARKRVESGIKVNSAWLFIAEFGYYFGWDGVKALRSNEISMDEATMLLSGARKVWDTKVYDHMIAAFVGSVSARSKKPSTAFHTATKDLVKRMKADV